MTRHGAIAFSLSSLSLPCMTTDDIAIMTGEFFPPSSLPSLQHVTIALRYTGIFPLLMSKQGAPAKRILYILQQLQQFCFSLSSYLNSSVVSGRNDLCDRGEASGQPQKSWRSRLESGRSPDTSAGKNIFHAFYKEVFQREGVIFLTRVPHYCGNVIVHKLSPERVCVHEEGAGDGEGRGGQRSDEHPANRKDKIYSSRNCLAGMFVFYCPPSPVVLALSPPLSLPFVLLAAPPPADIVPLGHDNTAGHRRRRRRGRGRSPGAQSSPATSKGEDVFAAVVVVPVSAPHPRLHRWSVVLYPEVVSVHVMKSALKIKV